MAQRTGHKAAATQQTGHSAVMRALVASRDVTIVQDAIAAKYDMFVSEGYVTDLIVFIDATNARITALEQRLEELTHERA